MEKKGINDVRRTENRSKMIMQSNTNLMPDQNNKSEIIDIIKYHIENKMIMNIVREKIDKNEKMLGFPLNISKELLLISRIIDFRDDGYEIIRLRDISDAYSKESQAFYEEICIKENLRNKAIQENPVKDITNFISVATQLSNYDKFISIQCEFEDSGLYHSIGKISDIKGHLIYFHHFDLQGIWENEKMVIPIDKITLIGVNSYYANTFYKYM